MKGIVFNLLEQAVNDEYGAQAWDAILTAADVDGVYTAVGSYDDEQLMRIVGAASTALETEPDVLVRWFGGRALPLLNTRYPHFFAAHDNARDFILTLNAVIHPEVRKLFPGADVPEFAYDTSDPDVLLLSYVSNRGLCALAEGLIDGAAAHFGEKVTIVQRECTKHGDARCLFACTFSAAES
ncbi:MAG TPA: heme NO-binding domain-containing protein [Acidimicrobiales bacterium]|nr:heme NO-binding domain-containing protein [Acidimicrobiales bacterium]